MESEASEKVGDSVAMEAANKCISEDAAERKRSDIGHIVGPGESSETNIYYGVALPEHTMNLICTPLVFTEKSDALKAIKEIPGSRFRKFSSREKANNFASCPVEDVCVVQPSSPAIQVTEEKVFKSLTSQQLVELRKVIEAGNKEWFLERVWSNPRFLINNADGPSILQVGSHYNALHVAAKSRQTEMCRIILSTISDLKFLALLYPEDEMLHVRRSHLLDLYLNMPDKSLSESPLHFACKYGAAEILQILLSYPECERNKANKFGVTPLNMICDRENRDVMVLKKQMEDMFQVERFVPMFRDKDNVSLPIIGEPCSVESVVKAMSVSPWKDEESNPVSCAFAGPMTYNKAMKFHSMWKTKKFSKDMNYTPGAEKILKDICKSDPVKGMERVGRKLARDLSTGWVEYWDIFDSWLDISSPEALELLEQHLRKAYAKKIIPYPPKKEEKEKNVDMPSCSSSTEVNVPLESVCVEKESESISEDEDFITPPQTPKEMDTSLPYFLAPELPQTGRLFLYGSEMSNDDIDIYRGIEKTVVDPDLYPYVFMWKGLMEEEMGPFLDPESDVSCTPPQSAAALRRSLRPRGGGARRSLRF